MPVDYIFFLLMKKLKMHEKETLLTERQLYDSIIIIRSEYSLPEFVRDLTIGMGNHLLQDLSDFKEYLLINGSDIRLKNGVSIEKIDNILNNISQQYDKKIIWNIDDYYDFNIDILKIIGINVNTNWYEEVMNLEKNIIACFECLDICEITGREKMKNKILLEIKELKKKRNDIFINLIHNLSPVYYNDLYKYSKYRLLLHNMYEISFSDYDVFASNQDLYDKILENIFLRSLFLKNENCIYEKELIISESFYSSEECNIRLRKAEKTFYKEIINFINKAIYSEENDKDKYDLISSKHRLMYTIDMLCQDSINESEQRVVQLCNDDYYFIKNIVFNLIDEIKYYTDEIIDKNHSGDRYYCNIYVILVKAYYKKTADEKVIEYIKNNFNYDEYHYVYKLFDDIIQLSKCMVRKKDGE